MIKLYKIFSILFVALFLFSAVHAVSIYAWPDQTINTNYPIFLSWSISDIDLASCEVFYLWEITDNSIMGLSITNPDTLQNASIDYNDTTTPWYYYFRLTATVNSCADHWTYTDDMKVSIIGNSPPTDIFIDQDNIDENNNTWDIVWYFSTQDPDDTLNNWVYTYFLVWWYWDTDNTSFSIQNSWLYIQLSSDYESKNLYNIRILTQDSDYGSFEKVFTIHINDLAESSPSIDAWPDQTVNIWSLVTLNWSKSNFPSDGCSFIYMWSTIDNRIDIANSWLLQWATFNTDVFTWATSVNISLQTTVSSSDQTHDSCGSDIRWTYNDNLTVNLTSWDNSSPGWWSSRWSRMRDEAEHIFKTPETIEKIDIVLSKHTIFKNLIFWLNRNYVGWDWLIRYELEYSNKKDFSEIKLLNQYNLQSTTSREYNIYTKDLDNNYITHYFRVRAFYKDKYSKWSNIIEYINQDNPLSQYVVKCIDCKNTLDFSDVLYDPEVLIEENFKSFCNTIWGKWCTTNQTKYNDIFDNIFYVPLPTYYKITK